MNSWIFMNERKNEWNTQPEPTSIITPSSSEDEVFLRPISPWLLVEKMKTALIPISCSCNATQPQLWIRYVEWEKLLFLVEWMKANLPPTSLSKYVSILILSILYYFFHCGKYVKWKTRPFYKLWDAELLVSSKQWIFFLLQFLNLNIS